MIIDVHGHVASPELAGTYPMPPALADLEGMLDQRSEAGIQLTIVGSPVGFGTMLPVPGHDVYAQPLDRLKGYHDWLREMVEAHAPRLAAYAFTNPFGGDEMLEQTARTVRDGGFVGLIVNTSVKGTYLDAEGADAFFEMVDDLDVPVFLHPPPEPIGTSSVRDFRLVERVLRFDEIATCLATLIFSGRLERHPKLRLIASAGGGPFALLIDRLDQAHGLGTQGPDPSGAGDGPQAMAARKGGAGMPRYQNSISRPPSAYLERVYFDTANISRSHLIANLQLVGPERTLFGTDSPPVAIPLARAIGMVEELPLSEEEQVKILHGNAERLFGLAPVVDNSGGAAGRAVHPADPGDRRR